MGPVSSGGKPRGNTPKGRAVTTPAISQWPVVESVPAEAGVMRPKAMVGRAAGATDPEWELVGINNRDLRTFDVDLDRSAERVGRLPSSALKVAESGIRGAADVEKLRRAGFGAFLIGERLVLSGNPATALAELLGRPAPRQVMP